MWFDQILVYPLLNVLMAIYAVIPGHDFGIAVIIITVIIRLILWPIVGKQLRSQKKMQELQPEISKIRAQTKGDKQKESQMLMELYKEREINPFSSCLPLLIQLPFLFALFLVFKHATGNVNDMISQLYTSIAHLPYMKTVIAHPGDFKPELFGVINMAKPSLILAVLAGITQFIQAKMLIPKEVDKEDQQARMTNMMTLLFPFLTLIIALRLPSALALYWTTTTLVAIFQQWWIINRETEKMETIKLTNKAGKKKAAPAKELTASTNDSNPNPKKSKNKKTKKGKRS